MTKKQKIWCAGVGLVLLLAVIGAALPRKKPAKAEGPAEAPARGLKATVGDCEVSVEKVRIDTVPFHEFGVPQVTRNKFLIVQIAVSNNHPTRRFHYDGWGYSGRGLKVTDNLGNELHPVLSKDSEREILNVRKGGFVDPGHAQDSWLIFDPPLAGAEYEYLDLDLSASQVGGKGTLRFRILRGMIK
jgi:hypothetical protein